MGFDESRHALKGLLEIVQKYWFLSLVVAFYSIFHFSTPIEYLTLIYLKVTSRKQEGANGIFRQLHFRALSWYTVYFFKPGIALSVAESITK